MKLDKLGFGDLLFQAKRWEDTVGRPEIQKFVGALHGRRNSLGVFVTTSTFSKEAREYSKSVETTMRLIDGEEIVQLLVKENLQFLVKEDASFPNSVVSADRFDLTVIKKIAAKFSRLSNAKKGFVVLLCFFILLKACNSVTTHPNQTIVNKSTIHVDARPLLPIEITYRKALFSKGLVAIFKRTSNRIFRISATFTNPTLSVSKSFTLFKHVHRVIEFGYSDGWDFMPGDQIVLKNQEYKPLIVTVPVLSK